MIKLIYSLLLVVVVSVSIHSQPAQYTPFQTVGIDMFGRSFEAVSGYKPKKQVGVFYWPWVGQPYASGIYDATEISAMPNGLKLLYDFKSLNDSISPVGQAHFWGQPLWGYYNSEDEWVIRKQISMLTTAGIDFIAFDLTNRVTYKKVYEKVFAIIEDFQKQGQHPPKAVFYTHSKSFETTWQLYKDLYKPGLYPDAWYRVNGKPMIIAYTSEADDIAEAISRSDSSYKPVPYTDEIKNFFYFKKPQWPGDPTYQEGFPWVEWKNPQPLHGNTMNVTVASHPQVPMSRSITSGWVNWGRGWDPETKQNKKEDVDKGGFFQSQWDYAIATDPDTVFVGGWNEWVAYKQPYGDEYMLCDAANREYSRDIEPMKGGYEDAFYIQLIKNVRRYKGKEDKLNVNKENRIDITDNPAQWAAVKAVYTNTDAKAEGRNNRGATRKITYTLAPPANNLRETIVTHDAGNFYFLIKAEKAFVNKENNSLQILIGKNEMAVKGWQGYEYVVEPNLQTGKAIIYQLTKERKKRKVGEAVCVQQGNLVQLRIPRKAIEALKNTTQIYFKVADGIAKPDDIMEYYVSGSAMPMGRLSYLYKLGQ
jgi:hypothetical protein